MCMGVCECERICAVGNSTVELTYLNGILVQKMMIPILVCSSEKWHIANQGCFFLLFIAPTLVESELFWMMHTERSSFQPWMFNGLFWSSCEWILFFSVRCRHDKPLDTFHYILVHIFRSIMYPIHLIGVYEKCHFQCACLLRCWFIAITFSCIHILLSFMVSLFVFLSLATPLPIFHSMSL